MRSLHFWIGAIVLKCTTLSVVGARERTSALYDRHSGGMPELNFGGSSSFRPTAAPVDLPTSPPSHSPSTLSPTAIPTTLTPMVVTTNAPSITTPIPPSNAPVNMVPNAAFTETPTISEPTQSPSENTGVVSPSTQWNTKSFRY
uniref:Uncharacterized protein n=1 Tax=Amphora coffeiformis TaxID=265554 RepID=A0A7S3P8C3_9STRA